MKAINNLRDVVLAIWQSKFPDAELVFLAGSVVRSEATAYSDLDLVVVYKKLQNAWRESFLFEGWPIEAFVHDPATLNYFFTEVDGKAGFSSLANMVLEGIPIPAASAFSDALKETAEKSIAAGPPQLSQEELDRARYAITDVVDDLRAPRNKVEAVAAGTKLYPLLADFYLRSQNKWSATGKAIPRLLEKQDPAFHKQFQKAFALLFTAGDSALVITLAEMVLKPFAGFLFAGHKLQAPQDWKK